jgi:carbamoyltransferase
MLALGVSGNHDTAAVLVRDGEVVVAIEEERLNRVKHTRAIPGRAIRACLEQAEVTLDKLDAVALAVSEPAANLLATIKARGGLVTHLADPVIDIRSQAQGLLAQLGGQLVERERFHFVEHHLAHAVSAYACSGFDEALVLTADGEGEATSGTIHEVRRGTYRELARTDTRDSLGHFYTQVTSFLGFRPLDEYKVMGLAPYGDPSRFGELFAEVYTLHADGSYTLDRELLVQRLHAVTGQRQRGTPVERIHQDLAAAAQATLERIVMHVLSVRQRQTGLKKLCLAGGVALNCTMNGVIERAGLFEEIFVQPAASDAGGALGAALHVCPPPTPWRIVEVAWGGDIGEAPAIAALLQRWRGLVQFEAVPDVCERAAEALAAGQVIGWAQGRSEFGPRALGQRSILADPRPVANREIVNRMVKKREAFRPFAPAVQREHAATYFDLPSATSDYPFMLFIHKVRPEHRETLGAITHVDGTARVQTVDRAVHPRFWQLLGAFGRRSGVPMLLNTSFNNSAEPIVESATDALVCFLTTGLHALALGDFWVTRQEPHPGVDALAQLGVELAPLARLEHTPQGTVLRLDEEPVNAETPPLPISRELALVLLSPARPSLAAACADLGLGAARGRLLEEVSEAWWRRLVVLTPPL